MLVSGNVSDTGSEMTQVSLTIHILCTYICLLGAWETLPRKTFSEWWWMEPLKRIKIDFLIEANPKFSKLWFNGHKPQSTTACRLQGCPRCGANLAESLRRVWLLPSHWSWRSGPDPGSGVSRWFLFTSLFSTLYGKDYMTQTFQNHRWLYELSFFFKLVMFFTHLWDEALKFRPLSTDVLFFSFDLSYTVDPLESWR